MFLIMPVKYKKRRRILFVFTTHLHPFFFPIDNKAIGVVKPGHIFTIEPMICEGVHQDLMW